MIDVHRNSPPTRPAMFVTVTEDIGDGLTMASTGYGDSEFAAIADAYAKLFMRTARMQRAVTTGMFRNYRAKQQAAHRARVLAQVQQRRAAA